MSEISGLGPSIEAAGGPGTTAGSDSRVEYRPVDPRAVTVWRLSGAITAATIGLASMIAVLIVALSGSLGSMGAALLGAGWIVGVLALAALTWMWPRLRYEHLSYRADSRGLAIRKGVLWQSELFIPRSRIQHTDVAKGPIDRSFGLAKLVVNTAGTQDASTELGGLAEDEALRLRDALIESSGDDAV
ncbi:MAG: PH domain-containing protein [Acidobacteria bacterium]|nr:PH domain-containing protein [Acidobacteriota bacterium]